MNRTLPLLASANFAASSAGMLMAGLLQLIAQELQWTPREAGALITVYALGFAIGAPLLGALLGQRCRKQVVQLGLALVALGSLATVLATATPWMELSRLVVAAGGAMVVPSVAAIAAYLFPAERPRALATVVQGMTLAVVFGLPLGTLVADHAGWRPPLIAAALLAAGAALLIRHRLPGGIVVPPVPLAAWRALLGNPRAYPLIGLSSVVVAANFVFYAYVASFLGAALGFAATQLSLLLFWYGLASFTAGSLVGRLSSRVGLALLMSASLAVLALALGLLHFSAGRPWLVMLAFALWAMAGSFVGTLQQSRLVDAAPESATAVLALNNSANFAGQAAGTWLGGAVIASLGLAALPGAAAAVATAALLLYLGTRSLRL